MAFYEDKREHYGGALVLFKRNLTVAVPNAKTHRQANWYMRLKIGGRKSYVTRSTRLTIHEDAYEYAKSELFDYKHLQQNPIQCLLYDILFVCSVLCPNSVFEPTVLFECV